MLLQDRAAGMVTGTAVAQDACRPSVPSECLCLCRLVPLCLSRSVYACMCVCVYVGRRTAPFRPPELFQVASDAVLDERSDIFSLGCTLYACLFRVPPFDGSATAALSGRYLVPPGLAIATSPGSPVPMPAHASHAVHASRPPGALAVAPAGAPVPPFLLALLARMLAVDPGDRPTITEVIRVLQAAPTA
jgi:serine/threonine protein kinase